MYALKKQATNIMPSIATLTTPDRSDIVPPTAAKIRGAENASVVCHRSGCRSVFQTPRLQNPLATTSSWLDTFIFPLAPPGRRFRASG